MVPALEKNLGDLTRHAIGHALPQTALLLFDSRSSLSRLLLAGYRAALPHAAMLDVDATPEEALRQRLDALQPGSLVVLLQSTRFLLGTFRFRLELFRRGLAVIEHAHLARVPGDQLEIYVDALAYDPSYFRGLGAALKGRIDLARSIRLDSELGQLHYEGPFEEARLNVGDYRDLPNVGGQLPIGEVFTEPVDLEGLSGTAAIFAYGAQDFSVAFVPQVFALEVSRGRVTAAPGAPDEFLAILEEIASVEGEVLLRELGFGINRAMTRTRRLHDVSAYERMCGIHMSLGAKHAIYAKPGIQKRRARFHVDIFAATDQVWIDEELVYEGGAYRW